jgi:hypothetical protein
MLSWRAFTFAFHAWFVSPACIQTERLVDLLAACPLLSVSWLTIRTVVNSLLLLVEVFQWLLENVQLPTATPVWGGRALPHQQDSHDTEAIEF